MVFYSASELFFKAIKSLFPRKLHSLINLAIKIDNRPRKAHRDVVSLLIYKFNLGIYSSWRAKPELIRSAGGWRAIWSQHGRTVRPFSQTADLSGACTDKLFSRARAEDFGSRRGPTDEHRSFIGQPSLGTGSGRSGAEEYEQSIALPSVPGRLSIRPQNKATTKQRPRLTYTV